MQAVSRQPAAKIAELRSEPDDEIRKGIKPDMWNAKEAKRGIK